MRWKLVPVEPTEEMLNASAAIPCGFTPDREYDAAVYRAMLAAAPAAPEAPSDAVVERVAEALWRWMNRPSRKQSWFLFNEGVREQWREGARAALAALRPDGQTGGK
jgi:hypothetical protein